MIRRNSQPYIFLVFILIFSITPIARAETNGLKDADTCRDGLEKDPEKKKDRSNWERCIELYKKKRSFKGGLGIAAYEIARLYQMLYFSADQFLVNDLIEAKRYYEMVIQQKGSDLSLVSEARKQLDLLKPYLQLNDNLIPIDPDASPPLRFELTPRLSFGAKVNVSFRRRENRDLQNAKADDDKRTRIGLSMAALYHLRRKIELYGEVGINNQKRVRGDREDETIRENNVNLRRGYLLWNSFLFPHMRLQIGRQKFKDLREWVYDETLDAARIFFEHDRFELQLSVSTNLIDPDGPEDKIRNYIAYAVLPFWKKDKAAVYWVSRRNGVRERLNLNFYGVSWEGKSIKRQKYWLQFGSVFGDEGPSKVRGYGFDLGWIRRVKVPWRPYFTLGYAFGSGDSNPNDGVDKSFRQTGLQDNDAKLWGVTKVKSYGELFDPELSNMIVGTVGFGVRPVKKASLDIVYHYYSQVWALRGRVNVLRDVGIKENPLGESRELGHEFDFIFGIKIKKKIKVEFVWATFYPGDAFANSDPAVLIKAKARYLF